jgi:hypothetical protein
MKGGCHPFRNPHQTNVLMVYEESGKGRHHADWGDLNCLLRVLMVAWQEIFEMVQCSHVQKWKPSEP